MELWIQPQAADQLNLPYFSYKRWKMQLWSSQGSQNMTLYESITTSLFTQEQTAPCSSSTWILPQKKPQIQKETMISLLAFHALSSRRQTQQISSHFPADGVHLFYFQVGLKYLEINQEIQRVEVRQLLRRLWDEPHSCIPRIIPRRAPDRSHHQNQEFQYSKAQKDPQRWMCSAGAGLSEGQEEARSRGNVVLEYPC